MIIENILAIKQIREYKKTIDEVYLPISGKVSLIKEKEIRIFFEKIFDASEKTLRALLFKQKIFSYEKEIERDKFKFWLEKTSLALIAYSYYCVVLVKKWYGRDSLYFKGVSFEDFFEKIFSEYNYIFEKKTTQKDIDYYASGYKEDAEMGYSKNGFEELVRKSCERDMLTIGLELLKKIWNSDDKNKGAIIGGYVWEVHKQLIRPYLETLTNIK